MYSKASWSSFFHSSHFIQNSSVTAVLPPIAGAALAASLAPSKLAAVPVSPGAPPVTPRVGAPTIVAGLVPALSAKVEPELSLSGQ